MLEAINNPEDPGMGTRPVPFARELYIERGDFRETERFDRPHPAFAISGLDAMADTLLAAGHDVTWDDRIVGVRRFFTHDPVGNKLEFIEEQVAE